MIFCLLNTIYLAFKWIVIERKTINTWTTLLTFTCRVRYFMTVWKTFFIFRRPVIILLKTSYIHFIYVHHSIMQCLYFILNFIIIYKICKPLKLNKLNLLFCLINLRQKKLKVSIFVWIKTKYLWKSYLKHM